MRCSLRPWTQCLIDYYRERDCDVTKPRIAVYKHNWKMHQNTVYLCNLRVAQSKGLQFYQTRSNAISFATLHLRCVSRGWWSGSQEKNCTANRISLLLYRKDLYWSRTCIMNARTPQALTRERPSTIPASTERIVTVERTSKVVAAK